jgi:hypothetical protein
MGSDVKIRNGAVWGLCFICSAIFFLTEPTLLGTSSSFIVRLSLLELAIFLFISSFIAHIRGFVFLGRKLRKPFLERSAQAAAITLAFFGLSVMARIFFGVSGYYEVEKLADGCLGLLWLLFIIAASSFGIAVVRLYKDFGFVAMWSGAVGLSMFFMWYPWPAILLVLPSTILLFRASI